MGFLCAIYLRSYLLIADNIYLSLYSFRFTQGDLAAIFDETNGLLEVYYLHSIKMHSNVTKPRGGSCDEGNKQ